MAKDKVWVVEFESLGYKYRTNADASCIEAQHNRGQWVPTYSLRVRDAALHALARQGDT